MIHGKVLHEFICRLSNKKVQTNENKFVYLYLKIIKIVYLTKRFSTCVPQDTSVLLKYLGVPPNLHYNRNHKNSTIFFSLSLLIVGYAVIAKTLGTSSITLI